MGQQDARRSANIRRIAQVMPVFSALVGVVMIGLYLITRSWQHLAVSALCWVHVTMHLYAVFAERKGRIRVASALLVAAAPVLIFAVSLFWSGLSTVLALTLTSVSIVIATMVMPAKRRGRLWVLSILMGGIVLATAPLPLPWRRLDVSSYGVTSLVSQLLSFSAIGMVVLQLALAYRRLVAIRIRLVVTFIGLVVIVALVVSATSVLLQIQIGQQKAFDQLDTTVRLKAQSVDDWIEQRQFALQSLLVESYEVQRAQAILLESLTEEFQRSSAQELRVRFSTLIKRTGWFTEIFLINGEGEVVLSSDRGLEGRNVSSRLYFQAATEAFYLEAPRYDPVVDGVTIVMARPLKLGNLTYGIVAARTSMVDLNEVVAAGQLGETGTTHLVNADSLLLTAPGLIGGYIPVRSDGIAAALRQPSGIEHSVYTGHSGSLVSGSYTWLPDLKVALMAEQDQSEVQKGALTTSLISGGVGLVAALAAVLVALIFANSISRPLSSLAEVATRLAGGDLEVAADVVREDEIGAVARAFNGMATQLRDLIGDLERRVEERTRGLQAVTEVSRATTSVLDAEELLPRVVSLAQQRFDLYYVGLFLLDEHGTYAELRAGTGTAGAEMLAQQWRLPVGGASMIGQCVAHGEAVIRQEIDDSTPEGGGIQRLANPLLPETRSELALPMHYGGRVTGAMTVQSTSANAFDETDISVLQNLADQVAVAVENARLFAETESALDRVRRAQRRYERQQWSEYLDERMVSGYELAGSLMRPLDQELLPEVASKAADAAQGPGVSEAEVSTGGMVGTHAQGGRQVTIPIIQGDQVVGVLGVQRDAEWSDEDVGLVRSLAEQLSLAAENQRLLDVTQRREAVERLTREVTSRMREPVELEDVLRTAADEIRQALGADWVTVRMAESRDDGNGA